MLVDQIILRSFQNVLVVILLISKTLTACSENNESEWKLEELQRKERVQLLIGSLSEGTDQERHVAYVDLRDTVIRRRDMPELIKQVVQSDSPEAKKRLQGLISLMNTESRLPSGGWTRDDAECHKAYEREFERLGCRSVVSYERGYPKSIIVLTSELFDFPTEAKNQADAVGLFLDLEPKALTLWESWEDVSFLGALSDLERLTLIFTSVTDLTPLKGLTKLKQLEIEISPVSDLSPLKGLPSLQLLKLEGTAVIDLAPLSKLTSLTELHLDSAEVIDLTPLKELPKLRNLYLRASVGNDLTPLKGMPDLNIQNISE